METVIEVLQKELKGWQDQYENDKYFYEGEETSKMAVRDFETCQLHIAQLERAIELLNFFNMPVTRSLPIDKILAFDQPYSLPEVLKYLIETSDILLKKKDYDGHGWEVLHHATEKAREIVKCFDPNAKE